MPLSGVEQNCKRLNSHDAVVRQHEFKRLRRRHLEVVVSIQRQALYHSGNSASPLLAGSCLPGQAAVGKAVYFTCFALDPKVIKKADLLARNDPLYIVLFQSHMHGHGRHIHPQCFASPRWPSR